MMCSPARPAAVRAADGMAKYHMHIEQAMASAEMLEPQLAEADELMHGNEADTGQ